MQDTLHLILPKIRAKQTTRVSSAPLELHVLNSSTPLNSGPRFNIKMTSYQNRKSHCEDKTILRPSYLHNGISYTGKTTSLYWIRAQVIIHAAQWSWRGLYWFHLVWLSVYRNVSALYLQQYLLGGSISYLHLSYQATSEGVSRVKFISKFELLVNSLNLKLWLCLVLTWDPIWLNCMVNHGAVWGILRMQTF